MSSPKISVIVPVYNVEKYLPECLDSIVNQTLKDIEIICLNDGSTDNSLSILKEYALKDERIILIDKENDGLGYTRKIGLDKATGQYILFCDSDDYYAELTAFEELYNYIEKLKVDVVIFENLRLNSIKKENNIGVYKEKTDYFNFLQKEIFTYLDIDLDYMLKIGADNKLSFRAYTWKKIYSKDFFDRYNDWYFPKHIMVQDLPLHFQVLMRARMGYINKNFYVYRYRAKSAATTRTDNKLCDFCKVYKDSYGFLKEKYPNVDLSSLMFYGCFKDWLINNYQIKSINTVKTLIDLIKTIITSDILFNIKDKEEFFFFRASFRMSPENYWDYLNKKTLKNKNKEIIYRDKIIKNLDSAVKYRDNIIENFDSTVKYRDNIINNLDNAVKNRDNVIKNLDNAVKHRDNIIKNLDNAVKDRDNIIKNLDNAVKDRDNIIKNLDNAVKHRDNIIKNLDNALKDNDLNNKDNNFLPKDKYINYEQNSWLYRIGHFFTYIRDYNLIKKSSLFDREYYLSNNEDVKKAKIDPIKHYLKFGWKEGRNPSERFNGNEYLNQRLNVRVAGICPLVHYELFGKKEFLSFGFDKIKYLENKISDLNAKIDNKISDLNAKIENKTSDLDAKIDNKTSDLDVKFENKTSNLDVKFNNKTADLDVKFNNKTADLDKFKEDILFTYNKGVNKEKLSYEIEKYFESSKSGITNEMRETEIIISLTSYPDRMYDVYYCIYSLITQSLKPNKIILWLGEEQFLNRDKDLPKKLFEFTKHGLVIKYTKDIRSYKKLIPALNEYPNALLVTADDDIFYPQNWLEKLYNCWKNHKDCVVCHRAHRIRIENEKLIPYNKWEHNIITNKTSFYNFCTTGGGVLYPPNSFYKDVLNEKLFMDLTPNADDIWFWAMVVLNDKKIKIVDDELVHDFLYVNSEREVGLNGEITLYSLNKTVNDTQLEKLINYYPQIIEKLLNE